MARYLGQHFLKNKKKIRKIVEALKLQDNDTIIEIGPGHGELTYEIVKKLKSLKVSKFKIIAIEKDKRLVLFFKKKFTEDKNIQIIEGDVLKILPKLFTNHYSLITNYKVVGNIPYYITGYLLRILSELENKPSLIVLLIQKEVAERACALRQAQGKPKMNLLAASVQFWTEPKILSYISKKNFQPQPKVDSAILKLRPKELLKSGEFKKLTLDKRSSNKCKNVNIGEKDEREKYYKFIKILFKQPRKTILNNLRDAKIANAFECREKLLKMGINPQARPQDLSVEEIIELSQMLN